MKLFLYECKKMIGCRKMLLLIMLLLLVNFGKITIYLHYNPVVQVSLEKKKDTAVWEYEKQFEGEITEEKAKKIVKGYKSCQRFMQGTGKYNETDEFCFQTYPLYRYQYTYHMMMEDRLKKAAENIKFYQSHNNFYQAELNRLIYKIYSNRVIDDYYNSEDFYYLFEYQFSTFLLLIFALVLSFQFFYVEKENGMYQMLISLGRNKNKVFANKYFNLFFGILLVGIVLYLQDVILFGKMLNLRGWWNPVYAIQSYGDSIFHVTILEYYLLNCGMRIGSAFLFALLCVFVEQWFSGKFLPVVAGGFIAVFLILTGDHYLNLDQYGMKLQVISVGNHPCLVIWVWLAVFMSMLVTFSILIHHSFRICN